LRIPSSRRWNCSAQDEKLNIEFSQKKFSQLGISFDAIVSQIGSQNGIESTGVLTTSTDNLQVRSRCLDESEGSGKSAIACQRHYFPSWRFCDCKASIKTAARQNAL
jgi:multidrug efflux pump subunit AcrB